MLRRTTTGTKGVMRNTSSRFIAGTIAKFSDGVAIAAPADEQIGQTCESRIFAFSSPQQQCSCAARTTATRSNAKR
jgi:hypothetical protein